MRRVIEQTPIIRQVYGYLIKRHFQTNGYGRFWGVYKTFEEARQAAPKTKNVGYNDVELAQEYQQMLEQENWENSGRVVAGHDYPLLFWLNSIFEQGGGKTIFDFGGNIGVHFYSYAKYLKHPDGLTWTVCEVPEIVKVGRQIAERRVVDNLDFTCEFKDIEGKDIFIGSGSIQYVENFHHTLYLKPRHLLINRLPLYNGIEFVTLQNGGKVFYPQYVFNKTQFIENLKSIGYKLIDIWENQGHSCSIPLHPDKSFRPYYGLYFKLED
jgi:putative methyltransferase (TIGR04325 family)